LICLRIYFTVAALFVIPRAPAFGDSRGTYVAREARFLYARNGMPMCFSNARPSSSDFAVVTIVTFIPFILSTFA
jgi:hypothetical protein